MRRGIDQHSRGVLFAQAKLVWICDKIDGETWINDGMLWETGRPVELSDEQEAAVAAYERRIKEAGCFVMPE